MRKVLLRTAVPQSNPNQGAEQAERDDGAGGEFAGSGSVELNLIPKPNTNRISFDRGVKAIRSLFGTALVVVPDLHKVGFSAVRQNLFQLLLGKMCCEFSRAFQRRLLASQ
jgi:hypothetical protein